ncbi:unnamed protein product, partial [Rotaria sp. Silwood1]
PTTFNMNTTPKIIKAIRFLTPVSLGISQQQSDQTVVR